MYVINNKSYIITLGISQNQTMSNVNFLQPAVVKSQALLFGL
jgi:hypothetical protein